MAYESVNPATGEIVKKYPDFSDKQVKESVDRAATVFKNDWSQRTIAERSKVLHKAAEIFRSDVDKYAKLLTIDMGKKIAEARGEVKLSADILDYYAKNGEKFLAPQKVEEKPGAVVKAFPLGLLLAIEPWNFPYYQLARIAGPYLIAGNALLVKHSSSVPQSAHAFESVLEEAGAPKGIYTNLDASPDQVSQIIEDPRVRGVTVTGSASVGAELAAKAGKMWKKSVMELGGSDAFIVLDGVDIDDKLIDKAAYGRLFNAGQVCCAAKRFIIVGQKRAELFTEKLKQRFEALKIGDPMDESTDLGPLSSVGARDQVVEQVEKAVQNGAKLVCGGKAIEGKGAFMKAGILTNIKRENPAYFEEFFGPIAQIYAVKDEAEAIELANDSPYGLGGAVFAPDVEQGRKVAEQIETGMVAINKPLWTAPELPFGGVKHSGYGRELSHFGIQEFINWKLIDASAA